MSSDRRRLANRRNAQKSTGPRTAAGKMRSRENAYRHGLTGRGVVVAPEQFAEVEAKRLELEKLIKPRDIVEKTLVERMALASVRMDRCKRVDLMRIARLEAELPAPGEPAGPTALDEAIEAFEADHELEGLLSSSAGCGWLVTQWEKILELLNTKPHMWYLSELERAIKLTGNNPFTSYDNDDRVITLRKETWVIQDVESLESFLASMVEHADNPIKINDFEIKVAGLRKKLDGQTKQTAYEALRAFVRLQIEELKRKQSQLHDEVEVPGQACAQVEALLDNTPEGARLHRYENMNELSYHRNYNALLRHRRQAEALFGPIEAETATPAGAEVPAAEAPAPAAPGAQNEPNGSPPSHGTPRLYVDLDLENEATAEGVEKPAQEVKADEPSSSGGPTPTAGPPPTA